MRRPRSRWGWTLVVLGLTLIVCGILAALWLLPAVVVDWDTAGRPLASASDQQQAIAAVRQSILFAAGGLLAIVTLTLTWRRDQTARRGADLDRDANFTARYTEAIKQLGDTATAIRLGGVYALERIAFDSDRDRQTILDVLAAHLRSTSRNDAPKPENHQHSLERLPVDTEAAIVVVGRISRMSPPLHATSLGDTTLATADLAGANLADANLTSANLTSATLTDANLTSANLTSATLFGATLTGATLFGATLTDVNLTGANLTGANLTGANLTGANLTGANLFGANLTGAYLTGAYLSGADLTAAYLTDANLTDANLADANLTAANLTAANLTAANLTDANLFGANLFGANLSDVRYSRLTRWPVGFSIPSSARMSDG